MKLCECGCGEVLRTLATRTDLKRGRIKGQPLRFIKGHSGRGRSMPITTRLALGKANVGRARPDLVERNQVLRDEVGYHALHYRVRNAWGYSQVCEWCSTEGRTEWANLNHTYNWPLVRGEWAELCPLCHRKNDSAVAV